MELYLELVFKFVEEFLLFLLQWSQHVIYISISGVVWLAIVVHLFVTGHATLGKNGKSKDIGCGDNRVWRLIVIFGGPAGMSFGLPYYVVMQAFGMSGIIREYWSGFIYVQFSTSLIQMVLLFVFVLFSERPDETWRFFKSHWKGCGWVSALSPIGWVLYVVQQFLSNRLKVLIYRTRDVETTILFVFNILAVHTLVICIVASALGQRVIIPVIVSIDEDHVEDEDSSDKKFAWSQPSRYSKPD